MIVTRMMPPWPKLPSCSVKHGGLRPSAAREGGFIPDTRRPKPLFAAVERVVKRAGGFGLSIGISTRSQVGRCRNKIEADTDCGLQRLTARQLPGPMDSGRKRRRSGPPRSWSFGRGGWADSTSSRSSCTAGEEVRQGIDVVWSAPPGDAGASSNRRKGSGSQPVIASRRSITWP